jgi:hypothetical protein
MMTTVKPSSMMFATISGCAQTACFRAKPRADKPARKSTGKTSARSAKKRAKAGRRRSKQS